MGSAYISLGTVNAIVWFEVKKYSFGSILLHETPRGDATKEAILNKLPKSRAFYFC